MPRPCPPPPSNTAVKQLVDGILRWRLPGARPQVAQLLQRAQAIAEESRDIRIPSVDIVHGDLNPSNVIVDAKGGGRITGIVDWENTETGNRAGDVAAILFYLWEGDAAQILWDHLVAITTEDARRLYLAGWACPALAYGALDRAAAMLDRAAG